MTSESKFQIFRAADAPLFRDVPLQTMAPQTDLQTAGMTQLVKAGIGDGSELRVLVDMPGFNVLHVWFKKDFPLPLHSHNTDCLYYIVSGSVQMGSETLGPRDSFFVPADAPYTYHTGSDGVELLEIRQVSRWNFRNLAKTQGFYDKAVETITANRSDWRQAKRPVLNV